MKTLVKEDLTRIGILNKVSGFKGRLSGLVEAARPEKLRSKKFLFILLEGLPVPFTIEEIEINENEILVKFENINSEEEAKKLLRKELYTEKFSSKNKTAVMSWKDLIHYTAIDADFGEIGIIEEVLEYPKQMLAKCMVNGKEVLFPLNEEMVTDINPDDKIVFLELPDGLLDVYLK